MGEQLTPSQRQDLVNRNRDVFSTEAGHTDLIQHQIVTEPGKRVKLRPYRIPEARREAIAAEPVSAPTVSGHPAISRLPAHPFCTPVRAAARRHFRRKGHLRGVRPPSHCFPWAATLPPHPTSRG
ncbi:hypothetical protein SKAU_G00213850 [Synaphobranchus kaupii]|uniref:Uncharacterized protein n=1 Tax=Synaphobranchus kaupii TaxID=118154 RepID=A0A9Q1F9U7_SYNKA|nr:hypothetical protein SKAU_G00213850 [Synaphobranchus kaupii]